MDAKKNYSKLSGEYFFQIRSFQFSNQLITARREILKMNQKNFKISTENLRLNYYSKMETNRDDCNSFKNLNIHQRKSSNTVYLSHIHDEPWKRSFIFCCVSL